MEYFKTFERYSDEIHDPKVNLAYIKGLSDSDIKKVLDDVIKSYNDANIAIDYDKYQYNNSLVALTSFRDELQSYNSENDKITLFRVLNVESEADIRKEKLGEHYTVSPNELDAVTLFDIGVSEDKPMYLVEVSVRISDINMKNTIESRVKYPHEMEVSLLTDKNVEIINTSKYQLT